MHRGIFRLSLLFLLSLSIAGGATAQVAAPYRLADLVTGPDASGSSYPSGWIEAGNQTFFIAEHQGLGPEIWVTDGTAGGTRLLADASPGDASDRPVPLGVVADRLLWWSWNPEAPSYFGFTGALWASDGTRDGTVRLLPDDVGIPDVHNLTESFDVSGGVLRFVGCTPDGCALWRSDGTVAGTREIHSLPGDRGAREVAVAGGRVFAIADGDLWSFEEGGEATLLVEWRDDSAAPGDLVAVGTTLFFIFPGDPGGDPLWTSDGTLGGTQPVSDLPRGSTVASLEKVIDDRLYFLADAGPVSARFNLWRTEGTPGSTVQVTGVDINYAVDPPLGDDGVVILGHRVFFLAGRDAISPIDAVWVSDGTPAGTRAITDREVGRAAYGGDVGRVGACWLYAGQDDRGSEPWCSEGTPGSARIVRDIEKSAPGSDPRETSAVGGLAVFSALDPTGVRQVWSSDGQAGSVQRLTDTPQPFFSNERRLFGEGGFALFDQPRATSQLWRTDGTENGTYPVGDLERGGAGSSSVLLGDTVYSFGDLGPQTGIWEIDGSPEGLHLAVPLSNLPGGLAPYPVAVGDVFYFLGTEDGGLWRSDGTAAGTWKVLDVPPDHNLLQPLAITEIDGLVYFVVHGLGYGDDAIWRTDGQPASAELFAMIPDFEEDQHAPDGGLHAFLGALYFGGEEGILAGRPVGSVFRLSTKGDLTHMVSSEAFAGSHSFTSLGDNLFFSVDDGIHGRELWRTDGTPAGTRMVADLHRGGSSFPAELTVAGDRLFFSAGSDRYGRELWETDRSGTVRLVADIDPGPYSSEPRDLTVAGDTLFFSADDGATGREPWALPLAAVGQPPLPPGPFLAGPSVPGFRFKVRITGGGASLMGHQEPQCIPETLCVSGQVPGRSEVFLRVVGPKPNGYLWPTLVKFSTSRVEVWVEQQSTGQIRYYDLAGAEPGQDVLPGLFDRNGFLP